MNQEFLDQSLGKYQEEDFNLEEEGDHILKLYYRGNMVARFSQMGATFEEIHRTCSEYLEKIKCPFDSRVRCNLDDKFTCAEIECPIYTKVRA